MSKSPNLLDNLLLTFRKASIGQFIFSKLREFRGGKILKRKGKKMKLSLNLSFNFKKILSLFLLIASLTIILLHIYQYFRINTKPYYENESLRFHSLDSEAYNILFIMSDGVEDYEFFEAFILVSINAKKGSLKQYAINEFFLTTTSELDNRYTLRTLYNNIPDNKNKMHVVKKGVENLLGVRVDRYIVSDTQKLFNFCHNYNLYPKVKEESLTLPNEQVIHRDEYINKESLEYYLLASEVGDSDVLLNHKLNFYREVLGRFKNAFWSYYTFWKFDEFSETFNTDMSREEMLSFLVTLSRVDLFSKIGFAYSRFGVKVNPADIQAGMNPDRLLIDESVQNVFQNFTVMKEQGRIEIFNGTRVGGLAGSYRRIFENIGVNVIKIGNYTDLIEETTLFIPETASPEDFGNTIKVIQRNLKNNVKISSEEYEYNYFGDLILVLGEDSIF